MKNFIIFIVLVLSRSSSFATSEAVILTDGSWDGEFQANEQGFWILGVTIWSQSGANPATDSMYSSFNDYSPDITNVGINTLMCEMIDCNLLGDNCDDTYTFKTSSKFISKSGLTLINNKQALVESIFCTSGITTDPETRSFWRRKFCCHSFVINLRQFPPFSLAHLFFCSRLR